MDSPRSSAAPRRVVIVGGGRLGTALASVLSAAAVEVVGPLARGEVPARFDDADVVVLAVPDDAIAAVASSIAIGPLVGHCSGALTLDVLGAHEGFSLHPLLSVTATATRFDGAACAVAGRSDRARQAAEWIATALRMEPIEVSDEARPLYHAAASVASNYLVTLEDAAEQLASSTGIERRHLARLAQSALDNWERLGGRAALTGPIVRGDDVTVRRQRNAVESEVPRLVPLWDALANATRALANREPVETTQ
jgi:predicted short-subunit dehydrogenase-like oxidoreductase (DUF2520 family)